MTGHRPAATLLLTRPTGEVALLRRAPGLRFLGGFWVFPGGGCDADEWAAVAALRETFEETGVLALPGAERVEADARRAGRARLLAGETTFLDLLAEWSVPLDVSALRPCGRYLTPPFGPVRYDTAFFIAPAPPGAELEVDGGEIVEAAWETPAAVLARWAADEALLAPPTRRTLEALRDTGGAPEALAAACPPDGEYAGGIDFWPGIRLFLLRTPTLPPATHTNCLIVGDGSELVVIDPASPYPEEQARLDRLLDDLARGGQRVREVLLTHHHPDHVGGAQHLADRLGVPIAAHARTRDLLAGRVAVTRDVADGEVIPLPADRPGARPRRLTAHLLEGHADGHLVFREETTGAVIAGDMVAGTGTIVVDPPEGKMALYLESLRRLQDLEASLLYPSHGPPIGDPRAYAQHYIDHRLEREEKVLAALRQRGPAPIPDLLPVAYDDKPPEIWPLARRAALAHLLKLEAEGRAVRDGERWALQA